MRRTVHLVAFLALCCATCVGYHSLQQRYLLRKLRNCSGSTQEGVARSLLAAGSSEATLYLLDLISSSWRELDDPGSCFAVRVLAEESHQSVTATLVQATGHSEVGIRLSAQYVLQRHGISSLPSLVQGTRSKVPETRRFCVSAICRFGEQASSTVPLLISLIGDSSIDVRRAVVKGLVNFTDRESVANCLSERIKAPSESIEVRYEAGYSLARMSSLGIPQLIRLLRNPDSTVRIVAASALSSSPTNYISQEYVSQLVEHLEDPHEEVRAAIADALSISARNIEDRHIPIIVRLLGRADTRGGAIVILGSLRERALSAAPQLVSLLSFCRKEDTDICITTITVLSGMRYRLALPLLIELAADTEADLRVRSASVRAIGEISRDPRLCVPFLIQIIQQEEDEQLVIEAIISVGKFGARALSAVEALCTSVYLDDHSRTIQIGEKRMLPRPVRDALLRIGPDAVIRLCEILRAADAYESIDVMTALSYFGDRAGVAVPLILYRCDSPESLVRQAALRAIARIGPVAQQYGTAPIRMNLRAEDEGTRLQAVESLASVGITMHDAIELMQVLLEDKSVSVRASVIRVFFRKLSRCCF